MNRNSLLGTVITGLALATPVLAQTPAPGAAPPNPDAITISGSWRLRPEAWDWFRASTGDHRYTFVGSLLRLSFANTTRWRNWLIELAQPSLINLPRHAVAPGAQGQLGLGGTYHAVNGGQEASLFIKQAFVNVRRGVGPGNQVRAGRFEFAEGAEVMPGDPTLAWLKRERIAQRLLGPYTFSHVGRSFDGGQFTHSGGRLNLTFVGALPTEGVFQLNGWRNLPIRVLYGAATLSQPGRADGRLFVLNYRDERNVLKVDNRSLAQRMADRKPIDITTFGGHYLRVLSLGPGRADLLLWGAVQTGDWGVLSHHASAWNAEAGYQPKRGDLKPWLRGGYYWSSGDRNPGDNRHETFFQVLPTPRPYARFPFFNGMNSADGFVELILRPGTKWMLRATAHQLRLTEAADLWYSGGGAYQRQSFGYTGRPSDGQSDLADLFDLSVEYTVDPRTSFYAYFGAARGGKVIEQVYPLDKSATFGYLELTRRW